MAGRQAKVLASTDLADLLALTECTRNPARNRVIVLLSAKAGLRAGEIANLTWDMVIDAAGHIGNLIELRDHAAKKGAGRRIPIHPDLADALAAWRPLTTGGGYVVRSERGGPMTAVSIVVWSIGPSNFSACTGVRRTLGGAHSSRVRPGSFTVPVALCGTFNC